MAEATELAPETIDVRSDEGFDEARLAGYLASRLEAADRPLSVRQFGGGHANLTYLLRFGASDGDVTDGGDAREYVLRRPPLGPVAKGAHDMHREYRALSVLWQAFPLAPRAFLHCDDTSMIGAEFLIMERRHGVVVRGAIPAAFGGGEDPEANRKLSEVVIAVLAQLHGVDAGALGLDSLGKPDGFLERQVRGWADRYERAKTTDTPLPGELVRWLEANLPESPKPTLLHNDWRLDNMAVAEDDPGRCVAVYDWDMCTVGDPLCDLGTLLCAWLTPDEQVAGAGSMPTHIPGFLARDEAIARYCARTGTDPAIVAYYQVFGCFKMGVVLQQIYLRFHRGQTQDSRFAAMGTGANTLFERANRYRP